MRGRRLLILICILAFVFSTGWLRMSVAVAAPFAQENKPENLKAYVELIHQTLYVKKDPKEAAALFRALIPDQERVKKALKDDVSPETVARILEVYQKLGVPGEAEMPRLFPQEKSAATVYGAATAEIAAYKRDSIAYNYFSGGARRLAQQVLRPGLTFFQVKVTAPGEKSGITYHLFYWDGQQWTMLGKAWQALKQD